MSFFTSKIAFINASNNELIHQYMNSMNNHEIRLGDTLIVHDHQRAVFIYQDEIADIFDTGTYKLNPSDLSFLNKLEAFTHSFHSPIKADLFFISTEGFSDNLWYTKDPVTCKDTESKMIHIKGYGSFTFIVNDTRSFMKETYLKDSLKDKDTVSQYLSELLSNTFIHSLKDVSISHDSSIYQSISPVMKAYANQKLEGYGIKITDVILENISFPDEEEKRKEEQTKVLLSKSKKETVPTAMKMMDAAEKNSTSSITISKKEIDDINSTVPKAEYSAGEDLMKYKYLLDDGVITQEEYEEIKEKILK